MNELRAVPLDLCMADAMPFQQHYEYRTTWPVEDLIHDHFFLPLRSQVRAGDEITICRFDSRDDRTKKLLEVVSVRIVSAGKEAQSVPLVKVTDVFRSPGMVEPGAFHVERAFAGKFVLKRGDAVVQEFGSKAEAEDALKKAA